MVRRNKVAEGEKPGFIWSEAPKGWIAMMVCYLLGIPAGGAERFCAAMRKGALRAP